MVDGYGVYPEAMREHAKRVDQIAKDLTGALDAARTVSMFGDAYGILCSPLLVPLISIAEQGGIAALSVGHGAVEATAKGVRIMADTYDMVEDAVTGAMDTLSQWGGHE